MLVAEVVASVLPESVASPQAASARVEATARAERTRVRFMVKPVQGQWREVMDQWTAVDFGVGVVCYSFGLVGARWAGSRSIRRNSWAFRATTMVEADIKIAPTAGDSTNPIEASTPAANGTARML